MMMLVTCEVEIPRDGHSVVMEGHYGVEGSPHRHRVQILRIVSFRPKPVSGRPAPSGGAKKGRGR